MFNKGLLLSSGGKGWAPYTHIVTVAKWPDIETYGYNSVLNRGMIAPKTLKVNSLGEAPIFSFISSSVSNPLGRISITIEHSTKDDLINLYLGRSDKRANFGLPNTFAAGAGVWKDKKLFDSSDVGKEIPVWISYTPPPY